jgi:hypothetical protein
MIRAIQSACILLVLTVTLAVGAVGFAAYRAFDHIADAGKKVGAAADGITATLAIVNRPCASVDEKGKLLLDGPICELDEAIHDVRKITTASGEQVKQTGLLISATAKMMDGAAGDVHTVSGALAGTANAATGTLTAATGTLDEGKRTIQAAQPLLVSYTRSGDDLDTLLKRKAIGDTLDSLAGITSHADAITGDAQRVSDDLTRRYFAPVPWWHKVGPFAEFGVKAGNKALGLW